MRASYALHVLCLPIIFVIPLACSQPIQAQPSVPSFIEYTPHIFIRADLERFRILRYETEVWRDGKESGIPLRELSGLPKHCWAIKYTFIWNDESPSPGHRPGDIDPEPIIIFVSDYNTVVGVQSRVHAMWPPINTALTPWDFVAENHIIVGFAPNVHTPAAGLLHALLALGAGNAFADLASAVRTLQDMVQKGIVLDAGH